MDILKTYSKDGMVQYSTSFEIKGNKAEYFIRGEGWKETRKYEIINTPYRTDNDWLTYAVCTYQFGDDVAITLTNTYAYNYEYLLRAEVIFAAMMEFNFPAVPMELLNLLRYDRKLVYFGYMSLDVFALDMALNTPDGTSTQEQIVKLYGKPAADFVLYLLGEQK